MVEVASTSLQKCRFACYIRHAVPRTGERSVVKKKIWMCLIPDSNTHPRLPVPHKFGSSLGKDSDAPHTKASLVPCSSWLTKQIHNDRDGVSLSLSLFPILRNLEACIKNSHLNLGVTHPQPYTGIIFDSYLPFRPHVAFVAKFFDPLRFHNFFLFFFFPLFRNCFGYFQRMTLAKVSFLYSAR